LESYRLANSCFICGGSLGSVSRKRVFGILICIELLFLFTKFYEMFVMKCWIFRWGWGGEVCIQMYPLGQKDDHVFGIMYLRLGYISVHLRRNLSLSCSWQKSAIVPLLPQRLCAQILRCVIPVVLVQ